MSRGGGRDGGRSKILASEIEQTSCAPSRIQSEILRRTQIYMNGHLTISESARARLAHVIHSLQTSLHFLSYTQRETGFLPSDTIHPNTRVVLHLSILRLSLSHTHGNGSKGR